MRARDYQRVSKDRSGQQRSNAEQETENRQAWPDWEWREPYRDVTPASRFARRARDDFPRLIADLESGQFGADVLVMWEASRGSRRVGEWVGLIDLCEAQRVKIAVTEEDRVYDPAVPKDRKSLIDSANDAEYETAKSSGRLRRATRANAAAGRPHGRRLYGYSRHYDPATKALTGQGPHPDEAPIVARIFAEYLAGRGIVSITRRLNADAITCPGLAAARRAVEAAPTEDQAAAQERLARVRRIGWTPTRVGKILDSGSYAAIRVHQGVELDAPAEWPALIDREAFERARTRRHRSAERHVRQSSTARLLTGVARCGLCTGRMMVSSAAGRSRYRCRECTRCSRPLARLDGFVTGHVLERLCRSDAADLLCGDHEDPVTVAARTHVVELRAELDDAMGRWKARTLSLAGYAEIEAHLLPRIEDAQRRARRAVLPLDLDVPPPERVPAWWDGELSVEQRREVVAALVVAVVVRPVGRGRRRYDDAEHTHIDWRH